ncbi:hypothetical protein TNCV_3424061 [Trichonephila clavipes]|nr:hypothetical protein TNCV_3424061 [Trichonephila clavipes]
MTTQILQNVCREMESRLDVVRVTKVGKLSRTELVFLGKLVIGPWLRVIQQPPLINLKNRFNLSTGREDPGVKSIEESFKTSPFYRGVMERASLIRKALFLRHSIGNRKGISSTHWSLTRVICNCCPNRVP